MVPKGSLWHCLTSYLMGSVGDQFTVVTFNTLFGTFSNEPVLTLAGDHLINWAVHYNPNDITLEVVSALLAADFDGDENVDRDDLLIWQTALNNNAEGDADADGDTDCEDFLNWQSQLGRSLTPAVPEPQSLFLGALAAVGLLIRRRALC